MARNLNEPAVWEPTCAVCGYVETLHRAYSMADTGRADGPTYLGGSLHRFVVRTDNPAATPRAGKEEGRGDP